MIHQWTALHKDPPPSAPIYSEETFIGYSRLARNTNMLFALGGLWDVTGNIDAQHDFAAGPHKQCHPPHNKFGLSAPFSNCSCCIDNATPKLCVGTIGWFWQC
jgi:hypothetical protein